MTAQRWRSAGFLLALVLMVPLLENFDAYRGYFADDDLGNLNWARFVPIVSYIRDLPCLNYPCEHNRPTGHFYYGALYRLAGLWYPPWVLTLQMIGLINVALLWVLLRKLGFGRRVAAVSCLFFGASGALADAWWKPLFIYDVLCTTFALAALLAYIHRRWVLSFAAVFLCIRTKEIGVVLPVILLLYEMTLGDRKWKRLIPFFLPALLYGITGLLHDLRMPKTSYTFGFGIAGLWRSADFYASTLLGVPYAGFLLLLAPLAVHDRRVYFGTGLALCALVIYIFLPDRLLAVYWYLAMTGVAIVLAGLAERWPRLLVPAVLMWAAWQFVLVKKQAPAAIEAADERRAYVLALQSIPPSAVYAYADAPLSLGYFGGEWAISVWQEFGKRVFRLDDPALPAAGPIKLLVWMHGQQRLDVEDFSQSAFSFVQKGQELTAWQAADGWKADDSGYRAVRDKATVRMLHPRGTTTFQWEACGSRGEQLRATVDGSEILMVFKDAGCLQRNIPVKPEADRLMTIEFAAEGSDVRVGDFGFK